MLEINLLGRKIHVRYVSDKELAAIAKDIDCWGCFEGDVIYISTSVPQHRAKRVLCHEVTHAILSITGLTNLFEDKQEEAVCDAFESYVDIFNSPDVVKFITSAEEQ